MTFSLLRTKRLRGLRSRSGLPTGNRRSLREHRHARRIVPAGSEAALPDDLLVELPAAPTVRSTGHRVAVEAADLDDLLAARTVVHRHRVVEVRRHVRLVPAQHHLDLA